MGYLSPRALKGLKQYQYKPGGYTLLDDIHQPFWNWLTSCLPMWLAPNLITLLGINGLVLSYLTTSFYLPDLTGVAPSWVYWFNGLAVLAYLHLDCIDGKQARRTKSSSPLGQLFDHGCDALSVHLVISCTAASLCIGVGWKSVAGQLAIMIPWMFAHLEEYHTGMMIYGNGYWGVTEANYMIVLLHWISAVVGPDVWQTRMADMLGISALGDHRVNDLFLVIMGFCSVSLGSRQLWRTITAHHSVLAAGERGHKELGFTAALGQLAQTLAVFAVGGFMMLNPGEGEKDPPPVDFVAQYIGFHFSEERLLGVVFGMVYALQASRLIMDHMSKEPFRVFWWPVAVMAVVIANDQLHWYDPWSVTWIANLIVLSGYLHYVTSVVDDICAYLGIHCLTIKAPRTA